MASQFCQSNELPPSPDSAAIDVSFVVPCLNEAATLGLVLERIKTLCSAGLKGQTCQIIVVDNGSTDNSREIAQSFGVEIVACATKGYGAALHAGICAARGEFVVYADADATYDFCEAPRLLEVARKEESALVLGTRLRGDIQRGAMPLLHRYVGTPALSFVISALFGRTVRQITDCNSGFRCIRRADYSSWHIRSTGMEFASELLIAALRAGVNVAEVPVSLAVSPAPRTPHLRTWRDGMRHLLQILLAAPHLFVRAGLGLFLVGWAILIVSALVGIIQLGPVTVFGLHSMVSGVIITQFGVSLWSVGLVLSARHPPNRSIVASIVSCSEEWLVVSAVSVGVVLVLLFSVAFARWASHGFTFLDFERELILGLALIGNGGTVVLGMVAAHLVKRVE